jgi:cyclic pyranopterin phosphate synthase
MLTLRDRFNRHFAYLRLSITDACNFKCAYCLPNGYSKPEHSPAYLNLGEIENLVTAFAELGVWKIRLTGGEPTLRRDLLEISGRISKIPGIRALSLSTNGHRLAQLAPGLLNSGVGALNVSVDTLDPARFKELTGHERLDEILSGIDLALSLGFKKVKINAVLLKDHAEEELELFQEWIRTKPLTVRFIELMRTGQNSELFRTKHVSAEGLKALLGDQGWRPNERLEGDGPAQEYSHPDFIGKLGIIAPYSKDFCTQCNRLRVTSTGGLRLCLFGEGSHTLRELLQSPNQKGALQDKILTLLHLKETSHELDKGLYGNNTTFSAMGG